jgi:hypothetical protein
MTPITTATRTTDVTRTLLGAGVVAGPLFVITVAVQALTRDGFDLRRHPLSMLALGEHGWIQVINFIAAGVLSLIFAGPAACRTGPAAPGHQGCSHSSARVWSSAASSRPTRLSAFRRVRRLAIPSS